MGFGVWGLGFGVWGFEISNFLCARQAQVSFDPGKRFFLSESGTKKSFLFRIKSQTLYCYILDKIVLSIWLTDLSFLCAQQAQVGFNCLLLAASRPVYEPQIRARLGTTAHFCEVVVLQLRAVLSCAELCQFGTALSDTSLRGNRRCQISTVTLVNKGSTFVARRSTLDVCLGSALGS